MYTFLKNFLKIIGYYFWGGYWGYNPPLNLKKQKLKIIISRTDGIGDLVLSIPSFYMLRKMYPTCDLTLLVNNYNVDIIKHLPYIDRYIVCNKNDCNKDVIDKLKNLKPDIFIALWSDKYLYNIIRQCKCNINIGPLSHFRSLYTFNYGIIQKRSYCKKNEAEYNLDIIKYLNPTLFSEKYEINTNIYYEKIHETFAKAFIKNKINNKDFIIIHPTNNKSSKNITLEEYIQIINRILKKYENIYIIVSCILKEKKTCDYIISQCNNKRVIAFVDDKKSILYYTALINNCKFFISSSTGPLHIAGALKKNVIGIYTIQKPVTYIRWGTFHNKNTKYILLEKEKRQQGLFFSDFKPIHIEKILTILHL